MEYHPVDSPLPLRVGRVHDVVGASATAFAIIRAAQAKTPVIWIENIHRPGRLAPQGLTRFFDPERLITVNARNRKEGLWCMAEALRESPTLVVASLPKPLDLLESRRLQLAAEAGGATGLCLVPEGEVNNAAETRWRSTPLACSEESTLHKWELIKNKKGILSVWNINWNATSHRLTVVSASGGRTRLTERQDARLDASIRSGREAKERLAALLDQRGG
jgi:protein ImuA